MEKAIVKLDSRKVINFLLNHFKNRNLQNSGIYQQNGTDFYFESNEKCWEVLLCERNNAFKSLMLEGFRIVDWFPRTPGLYHTEDAVKARNNAEYHLLEEKKGVKIYDPRGKSVMNNDLFNENNIINTINTINTSGGNYIESILGNYIEGNYND
jgi:hypothetical protein